MRAINKFLALTLVAALQPAVAGTVTLNFEDLSSFAALEGRYSQALGVTFKGAAYGAVSSVVTSNSDPQPKCGGSGDYLRINFTRPNSCGGLFLYDGTDTTTGTDFVLNLAGGFISEFTFFYATTQAGGGSDAQISVYDEADGLGNALNSASGLAANDCPGNSGFTFCDFKSERITFTGVAQSLRVTGFNQRLMLDDLTFTTPAAAGTPLPEPASAALVLGALGALAWVRQRRAH